MNTAVILPSIPLMEDGVPVTLFNAVAACHVPTLMNPETAAAQAIELRPGDMIGPYAVERALAAPTGEAALYLCAREGRQYAAKLYRRRSPLSDDVTRVLREMDSPHVARLVDTLELDGHPVEILPYYKNGSLAGRRFTYEELRRIVIPGAIEGLRALHSSRVLHRDLKPSNIMLSDDGCSVALIDFGIAAYRAGGGPVVAAGGMTPEYSAPETFVGLYLEESDYYSLGITLYELFCGAGPYRGLTIEDTQARMTQPMRFPDDMPQELRELICALTYPDITNRFDKYNPNRRWKYDEVRRFLAGEMRTRPGAMGVVGAALKHPIDICGETANDLPTLTRALAQHWDEGRELLLGGMLAQLLRTARPDMEEICLHAQRDAARRPGHEDIVYWKALYRLDPHMDAFYWRGARFDSIAAFGRAMLEALWAGDRAGWALGREVLAERVISEHLRLFEPDDAELAASVAAIEDGYAEDMAAGRAPERACYRLAYLTSGHRVLDIGGQRFRSVDELNGYMKALLSRGYKHLEKFCHKLIDYDCELEVQLECWLTAIGRGAQLDLWREQMRQE